MYEWCRRSLQDVRVVQTFPTRCTSGADVLCDHNPQGDKLTPRLRKGKIGSNNNKKTTTKNSAYTLLLNPNTKQSKEIFCIEFVSTSSKMKKG